MTLQKIAAKNLSFPQFLCLGVCLQTHIHSVNAASRARTYTVFTLHSIMRHRPVILLEARTRTRTQRLLGYINLFAGNPVYANTHTATLCPLLTHIYTQSPIKLQCSIMLTNTHIPHSPAWANKSWSSLTTGLEDEQNKPTGQLRMRVDEKGRWRGGGRTFSRAAVTHASLLTDIFLNLACHTVKCYKQD